MEKKRLLKLNLQHFANPEEQQAEPQPGATPEPNQGSHNQAGQPGKDVSPNEHMIPKSRFNEVNDKLKELQSQLETFDKQKEQAELEAKKKKGEFEDLYNTTQSELENYKTSSLQTSERVGQLEGIIQNLVDAELEAVPEDYRDLVPSNFTPEQKLEWITTAKKKGIFGNASNKQNQELGGATNSQPNQQTDVSKMSIQQLFKSAYGSK